MYKRGAIPSPPDARDYTIAPSAIPRAVDYEWYARKPKIGKQKQSNCANAAIGYAAESVTGIPMTWGGLYGDREPNHYQGEGRIIREALDTALKHGFAKRTDYPYEYEVSKAQSHIQSVLADYRKNAGSHRIKAYALTQNEMAIKAAIKNGLGVVFCAPCPSFKADGSGTYRMNNAKYGYHAMSVIGWRGDYAYCPQSWGTGFGLKGFCYVPFTDILALGDVWAIEFAGAKPVEDGGGKKDAIIRRTLRKGMKGADVKALQEALIKLGYDLGKWGADGDFGSATHSAVRAYQYAKGLTVDGIAGPKTWEALDG